MGFYNLQFTIYNHRKAAFTLVEILIVVAILGIIAAIVLPEFQTHTAQAKEAAAKESLRMLRDAIERYTIDNGVPPGYMDNDSSKTANFVFFQNQLVTNATKKYLSKLPVNPFNELTNVKVLGNTTSFPDTAQLTTMIGWYYKPATSTIRLNWTGTDSEGNVYFEY